LGVTFSSIFYSSFYFSIFLIFLSAILFVIYFFNKNFQIIFLIAFCFLSFGLGSLRLNVSEAGKDLFLESHINETVEVEGVVSEEPDERENSIRLIADLSKSGEVKIHGKVLVITGLYPKFKYGDRIKLKGKIERPKNFESDVGKEFDYISYLAKDGIGYEMFLPKIAVVSRGNGNFVKEKLFALKEIFTGKLNQLIPQPESALLGGLLIGEKQSLGKELQNDFRTAGIIHIVVLSGYNITIVADSIMKLVSFLPKYLSVVLGSLSIILFGIMTGGSATVVRSCIMSLLIIIAKANGRVYQVTRALFIAGFLMILQNPKILVFDPSFQLSFMATFGLIFLSPVVGDHLFPEKKFFLKEIIVSALTTQIFLLPLFLYSTGNLSIDALPVNLLVLCFIPITMFFGFFAEVLSFISRVIASPFSYIAYSLLHYEISVVEFFSHLPFASVQIKNFPFWLMVFIYAFYGIIILKFEKKKVEKV
jgi:competence protein ComEC